MKKSILIILIILISIGTVCIIIKKNKDNEIVSHIPTENVIPDVWEPFTDDNNPDEWNINNVSMVVKPNTLSKTEVTVIITDNNNIPSAYGEQFSIEKKEDNQWKSLKQKWNAPGFNEIALVPRKDRTVEMKINIEANYGKLEKGIYRIVKDVKNNQCLYCEIEID